MASVLYSMQEKAAVPNQLYRANRIWSLLKAKISLAFACESYLNYKYLHLYTVTINCFHDANVKAYRRFSFNLLHSHLSCLRRWRLLHRLTITHLLPLFKLHYSP